MARTPGEVSVSQTAPVPMHQPPGLKNLRQIALAAAGMVGVCLVFLPMLHYALVYDDWIIIVGNQRLTSWSFLPGYFTTHLFANSPMYTASYYRPLHLLCFRLLYVIFGSPSSRWHLGSMIVHLAAIGCVYLLIRRLGGKTDGAVVAAALFAIHPIQTEAVCWLSSICDPLVTTFTVLSVYFYVGRKAPFSLVSIMFAGLAMFTKETGVVIPALILAYELTQSRLSKAIQAAMPYLIPEIFYFAFRLKALGRLTTGTSSSMSIGEMMLTWPRVLGLYALHFVWPVNLSASYEVPVERVRWPLFVLIAIIAACVWALKGKPARLIFGAAWFVITLAPALSIRFLLPNDFVHDRYLYLPFVGLAIMVSEVYTRIPFVTAKAIASCALILLLILGTRSEMQIWQDEISLYRRAVVTSPRSPIQKNNLASAYLDAKRASDALPLLEQAISIDPSCYLAYYNLGRYYESTGDPGVARYYYSVSDQLYRQRQH